MKYVLGVDGGSTKTHCALFDPAGNRVDMIGWGPMNHEAMKGGYAELKAELGGMLEQILNRNGAHTGDLGRCVFGLSGADTRSQHKCIEEVIAQLGIYDFILCNDGFLGIKAGCRNGYGICAINGTGVTACGIDPSGEMLQIGGQGALSGDWGGGGDLGKAAVGAVYNSVFKDYTHTQMTDILFEMLGIQSKFDMADILTDALSSGSIQLKDLNRVVFTAANLGDEAALNILKHMGRENARSIHGLIRGLNFPDEIEIVLAGSIYVKGENPAAVDALKEDIRLWNPEKRFVFRLLEKAPVSGAVVWALQSAGDGNLMYDKVISQF